MTSRLHESTLPESLRREDAFNTPLWLPCTARHEPLNQSSLAAVADDTACWLTQENQDCFFNILDQKKLHVVFQPILDFRAHRHLGFEGLIRGPVNSPLHAPQALLAIAQACNLTLEFERLCLETVLHHFSSLELPGRLFINVSAGCLANPRLINENMGHLLQSLRLRPGRIVIEITENQKVSDFAAFREILACYRKHGYAIAIDDLGEGFSNLRMWSEVRPEFVKIDKHFIRDIDQDPLKFRLVQAMRDLAENSHATLIAEGIETEDEFITVRDLGIACGQGFLIGRPASAPTTKPAQTVLELIARRNIIVFPRHAAKGVATVRQLLQMVEPLSPQALNEEVYRRFEAQPNQVTLPVVMDDGTPIGLINRYSLIDHFTRPFCREIYGKRSCIQVMNTDPVIVGDTVTVQELGHLLGNTKQHQLADGFIITENGHYLGIGSSHGLMGMITEMQMHAARYANPLTQLPGNVPIDEHIERLLENEVEFVACYCDLDHFKPYNDTYGYRKGDQIIQALATILGRGCDSRLDFVGHIGGDDFILLMQSTDWEPRCHTILGSFATETPGFVTDDHLRQGGYNGEDRRGKQIFHPLPSLSIGALVVEARRFHSHHEVSCAVGNAKQQAKKIPGNSLFVERRHF